MCGHKPGSSEIGLHALSVGCTCISAVPKGVPVAKFTSQMRVPAPVDPLTHKH